MGKNTSFWFDVWSTKGKIYNLTGPRGYIDMGIPAQATVASVLETNRRRKHRLEILNDTKAEIMMLRQCVNDQEDITLWKNEENKFSKTFTTKRTWKLLRSQGVRKEWTIGV